MIRAFYIWVLFVCLSGSLSASASAYSSRLMPEESNLKNLCKSFILDSLDLTRFPQKFELFHTGQLGFYTPYIFVNQESYTAWGFSKFPVLKMRAMGVYAGFWQVTAFYRKHSEEFISFSQKFSSLDEQTEAILFQKDPFHHFVFEGKSGLPVSKAWVEKVLTQDKVEDESQIGFSALRGFGVCSFYGLSPIPCSSALGELVKQFRSGTTNNLGGRFLAPVLTTDRVQKGALEAAKIIFKRMKSKDLNGNLFSDVVTGFRKSGMNAAESEKWAWDLILVSFIHGQNVGDLNPYAIPENFWTLISAQIISVAAVYLDTVHADQGLPLYTLPENRVTASCDNGKPYHFWVTAYASRYLVQHGYDPAVSQWAAYLTEVGYQGLSESKGRDPNLYLREKFDSALNQKNRLDLAYAAAGARYGTIADRAASASAMNIDLAFEEMLKQAKKISVKSDLLPNKFCPNCQQSVKSSLLQTARFFYQWNKMMKPSAALKALQN